MTDSIDTSEREAEEPREPIRLPQRAAQEGDLPPLPNPEIVTEAKDHDCPACHARVLHLPPIRLGYTADQMREYARLALAAAGGGVPPGYKLVPVEPTREMYTQAWREAVGKCDHATMIRIYRAMLASSPQPEAAPAVAQVPQECPWCNGMGGHEKALSSTNYTWVRCDQCHGSGKLAAAPEAPAQADKFTQADLNAEYARGRADGWEACVNVMLDAPNAPAQAAQSAGEVERGDVVAFEFYNRATGHAIVDYSVNTHVGNLSADKGYEARPLVYADKREEVTDGSKPIPLWQAREALDELEAAARGDAPFNHQAAAVVRAALSHKEQR